MKPAESIYSGTARESAVLTTSYVYHAIDGPNSQDTTANGYNQILLYITFTIGSLTSAEFVFEFSHDKTNWFRETTETIASGVATAEDLEHKLVATGTLALPNTNAAPYIRIGVKGTGTVTGSLLGIDYSLSYT